MAVTVEIPDFEFAAFYYADLLDALIEYKRRNVPEHTDESAYDPLTQMLRSFALIGHLNNCLLDVVANESTLPTAQLPEQVRKMLQLIDYQMASASPSTADVIFELSKVFNSPFELIPERSQASTEQQDGRPEIRFENLEALTISRTDRFTSVLSFDESSNTYTDITAKANDPSVGQQVTLWASPAVQDSVLFGHGEVMWDQLDLFLNAVGSGITGVWEFYDGDFAKAAPDSVSVPSPGALKLILNGYLGSSVMTGTLIRVRLNETGASEDVYSQWDGSSNYVETTSYLGQTVPSTDAEDYTVGSDWQQFARITDGSSGMTDSGIVDFDLPQSLTEDWALGTFGGIEAYWMRIRIVAVAAPVSPILEYARIDLGAQYAWRLMTQGRTQLDTELGSSDGTANQTFETTKDYFLDGSMEVYVDGELWTEVENFLASRATGKHYRVDLGEDDRATVIFGDGVTGKIPPAGVGNIEADYRWGANENGNTGSNTIVKDKSGLTYIKSVYNPRPASGWEEAEGATKASLERAKIEGPASLRTKSTAVGPGDVELMAIRFVASTGSRPYSRAKAYEEGFGPKTVELVVVGQGGAQVPAAVLKDTNEYFNGNAFVHPPLAKRIVANQEVTSVNFTPHTIDIVATVYGVADAAAIEAQLAAAIQPEALKADGVTYEWEFGEDVPLNRLIHEIFATSEGIENVVITSPAVDVPLSSRELPSLGTVSVTVVAS